MNIFTFSCVLIYIFFLQGFFNLSMCPTRTLSENWGRATDSPLISKFWVADMIKSSPVVKNINGFGFSAIIMCIFGTRIKFATQTWNKTLTSWSWLWILSRGECFELFRSITSNYFGLSPTEAAVLMTCWGDVSDQFNSFCHIQFL